MNGNSQLSALTIAQLQKYNVNIMDGTWEAINQDLYDSAAYPAAGTTQLTLFQLPVGQSSKTLSDTNMTLAGQLPANQVFLAHSVEVEFWPTTPTVTADMPAVYGAGKVATLVNDAYIFRRSGNLQFNIGSKNYLQSGPMGRFPAKTHFNVAGDASDTSTAGTGQQFRVNFADMIGRPFLFGQSPLLLVSNQNFSVSLNWPEGVQAITDPAKVFVRLDGVLYRRPQ